MNRLASAVTVGPEWRTAGRRCAPKKWGNIYGYDGFGNLTSMTVVKDPARTFSGAFDPLTNRMVGATYDANGNQAVNYGVYDIENRLTQAAPAPGNPVPLAYGYDAGNKRVYRQKWLGTQPLAGHSMMGQRFGFGVARGPAFFHRSSGGSR